MITDPDLYFRDGCGRCARFASADCSARHWARGLAALRQLCLSADLTETAKWGHPCYTHAGRNIAILGAFRDNFRLNFFDASLLSDPEALLTAQGANTQTPGTVLFTDPDQVAPRAGAILGLLAQAKAHATAGLRAPRSPRTPEMPPELTEALAADPALALAFAALTPGRRNSHILAVAGAKASATRHARIARLAGRIHAGKGATER